MKARYHCCFLLLLCATGPAWAEDKTQEAEVKMVAVNAQFIRASADEMKAANPLGLAVFNAEQLNNTLGTLKSGGAEFLSNPRSITLSGQRAEVKATRELMYPTEFADPTKTDGKSIPTAFENQDIGTVFSFEPVAGPRGRIDLTVDAELTRFLGFIDYSNDKKTTSAGKSLNDLAKDSLSEGSAWQPLLSTFNVKTRVTLKSEQTALLGGMEPNPSPPADKAHGKLIYVFITARLIESQ